MSLEMLLKNKTAKERADIKGREIAKVGSLPKTSRANYDIEIVDTNAIDGGVEVFARAWKGNKQIGFGKDGTVDIERFRIINPPVLVPDENGDIVREWTDEDGNQKQRKLREDTQEALLRVLEHNLSVMRNIHDDTNIVVGKTGNTTSTFFPDAGTGGTTVDGLVEENTGAGNGVAWSTIVAATGSAAFPTTAATWAAAIVGDSGTDEWRRLGRGIFLFDTSSIPDTDTIDSATFSIDGSAKADNLSVTPNINVYSSNPASNGDLVGADFSTLGSTAFSTAIAYGDYTIDSYNDFALNASGIAAVNKTGVSKFGTRNANYDVADVAPTWSDASSTLSVYYADETGTTTDPKLVVVHTAAAAGAVRDGRLLTLLGVG